MRSSCWLILEPCRTRQHQNEFRIVGARKTRPTDKPAVKVTITLPDDAFQFVAPEIDLEVAPNTWTFEYDPEVPSVLTDNG